MIFQIGFGSSVYYFNVLDPIVGVDTTAILTWPDQTMTRLRHPAGAAIISDVSRDWISRMNRWLGPIFIKRSPEKPNDWEVSSCVLSDLSSRHRTLPSEDDKVFR